MRRTHPIEVAAEVVAPQEVPKPVEAKPKPRVKGWKWPEPTSSDECVGQMGQ